jgi:hypothetical protein
MRLSKNFHLNEFIKSATAERMGINNDPASNEHLVNLAILCHHVLQPIREEHGIITINSGYRSPDLNKAVRGSEKSQHCQGEAADFESFSVPNPVLAKWIKDNLEFDQLILEFYDGVDPNSGWIHCSFKRDGTNRSKVMTALKKDGKVKYEQGLLGVALS